MRRPTKASAAIAQFAAGFRERHDLQAGEEFFLGRWRWLPDDIDTSAFEGRPEFKGWRFTADNRMEPVRR
ncbi:MAG: hypothetical protein ACRDQ2_08720 [Gaiellales bacterium]